MAPGDCPERDMDTEGARAGCEALREAVIGEMKRVFGDDERRIRHSLAVLDYAERILERVLERERGDPLVVTAAAVLHDIGIHEAERKHGSTAGKWQEVEGPPIARAILEKLEVDPAAIDHVCRIIANHHSARDIDTPEFRIIWDADWLVNIPEDFSQASQASQASQGAQASRARLEEVIARVFKTTAGNSLAQSLLPAED